MEQLTKKKNIGFTNVATVTVNTYCTIFHIKTKFIN